MCSSLVNGIESTKVPTKRWSPLCTPDIARVAKDPGVTRVLGVKVRCTRPRHPSRSFSFVASSMRGSRFCLLCSSAEEIELYFRTNDILRIQVVLAGCAYSAPLVFTRRALRAVGWIHHMAVTGLRGRGKDREKQCAFCERTFTKEEHLKRHQRSRKSTKCLQVFILIMQILARNLSSVKNAISNIAGGA